MSPGSFDSLHADGRPTCRAYSPCLGHLDYRRSMKRVRYTKYNGDLASEMEIDDLLKALSDYLLDSGFQDPFSRFAELDGDHTMENLREALRQALESGELFDQETQDRINEMSTEEMDQLIEKLMDRMEQENYISVGTAARPLAHFAHTGPGRAAAGSQHRERPLRSH